MFTPADDAALGIPVEHSEYPEGEAGIVGKSIRDICKRIREGMATAVMMSFAANALKEAGMPETTRARSSAFLDLVRRDVMYAPDPLGTEKIQSAMVTLCVQGAPVCIPMADCDDMIVALGTLCAASGMDVEVVRQYFGKDPKGADYQEHVLLAVKTEDGMWFPLDPSSKTMPAGQKAHAVREKCYSPWDGSLTGFGNEAQFIGIGSLPVLVWGRGWRRVPETATLEAGMRGLGAIWEGAANLQPQIEWLGQAWALVDAKGRGWTEALADAIARASAGNWPANDPVAKSDLLALIVSSSIQARAVSTMPDIGGRASDALNRTWVIFAKHLGFKPGMTKSDVRARMKGENASAANLAVLDLVLLIVVVAAVAAVYAFAIYSVAQIVNRLLVVYFLERELIRKHVEWQKIVDKHLQDGTPIPDGEQEVLKRLEAAQAGVTEKIAAQGAPPPKEPSFWDSPWAWAGLATVVGGTVLAVVYREEIKQAMAPSRKRLTA